MRLSVDYDALASLNSAYTSQTVWVRVSWNVTNPFYGTSGLRAGDYSVGVSAQGQYANADEVTTAYERLLTSTGTNLTDILSRTFDYIEDLTYFNGALLSPGTQDATLTARVEVRLRSGAVDSSGNSQILTGTHVAEITGFTIAKTTDSRDADSAYVPYGYMSGTSMATPMITGSIGTLAAINPNASALQLRGLVCGGTHALTTMADQDKIASGGSFTFDAALDNATVSSNTWSITTSETSVTVHGYNLDRASLTVDGTAVASSAVTSQTAGEITFTAPTSLLDGHAHRFDVTDSKTGSTYKASYVTPQKAQGSLVRVCDLPTQRNADNAQVFSSPDALYLGDTWGTYLYGCTNPLDPTSSWVELAAPGSAWTCNAEVNRAGIAYVYGDGKVCAVACDSISAASTMSEQARVMANVYDIRTGEWSGWRAVAQVAGYYIPYLGASYCRGLVCVETCAIMTDNTSHRYILAGAMESSAFSVAEQSADLSVIRPKYFASTGVTLYGLGIAGETTNAKSMGPVLLSCDAATGLLSFPFGDHISGYGKTSDATVASNFASSHVTNAGNGIVACRGSDFGLGDIQLVDVSANSAISLGSYGFSSADGLTVPSMVMFGGRLYLNCLDHAASAGSTRGAVYTLPRAATPAEGYSFSHWVNENGVMVSSSSDYSAIVTSGMKLTAVFSTTTTTPYTVEHYLQLPDGTYPSAPNKVEHLSGTTGSPTAAAALVFEGYTVVPFEQGTIGGDGSTVVRIRYTRNAPASPVTATTSEKPELNVVYAMSGEVEPIPTTGDPTVPLGAVIALSIVGVCAIALSRRYAGGDTSGRGTSARW